MTAPLTAPFPWFGGKSKAAPIIWARFGGIKNYVEPFFGSGAVLLQRPKWFSGPATLNDIDGNVANFWRAVAADPETVADFACAPVNECDLHARHVWLVKNAAKLPGRLMADPVYCEPKTAGWWAWGLCSWIGGGWCSGKGPWWPFEDDEGVLSLTKNRRLPHLGDAGKGVNRQLPHLGDAGKGVNRQLPHLGNAGMGVNRQLPHLGNAGMGARRDWLTAWCQRLAVAMSGARVTCGDWERVCSPGTMARLGAVGVVLDPPYSTDIARVYAHDSDSVAHDVRAWCEKHGDNQKLRIALCGHEGEHDGLLGWSSVKWSSRGYQGADDRERIWFSPHCTADDGALFKDQGAE